MSSLYRLFLSTQATRGRIIGLLALGAVGVVLGYAIGISSTADPLADGTLLISSYGLTLFVPVATLVFAASVLGDPNEDGTLVYLWLRPIARWRIVAAALAATLSVTLPVVVVPMVLAAAATGGGAKLVVGTIASCALATVAYTGIFTWVGLRMKRSFMWGLAYILIWEGFVASAGKNSARLAVRAHARSLLSHISGGPERLIEVTATAAVIVPLLAAAVAVWFTIRRLTRQDVA